jgi:hypothetical protein
MRIASWLTSSDSTDTSAMDGSSRPSRGGDVSSTTPHCRSHRNGPGHFQATSRSLIGAAAVTQRARITESEPEPVPTYEATCSIELGSTLAGAGLGGASIRIVINVRR